MFKARYCIPKILKEIMGGAISVFLVRCRSRRDKFNSAVTTETTTTTTTIYFHLDKEKVTVIYI